MAEDQLEAWKKWTGLVIGYSIVVAGVVTAVWLMLRNEPFREPMLAYGLRVFLTLAAGVAGGVIPGTFSGRLEDPGTGWKLQTTGAIGFAAFTYFTAPFVAPNLDPANVQRIPPEIIVCRVWTPRDYLESQSFNLTTRPQALRVQWVERLVHQFLRHGEPVILAETATFPNPYRAFSAAVRTIPATGEAHEISAFLVHGEDTRKTFTPLVSQYAGGSLDTSVIHVPETQRGDYLFLMILVSTDEELGKGDLIPLQLFVL